MAEDSWAAQQVWRNRKWLATGREVKKMTSGKDTEPDCKGNSWSKRHGPRRGPVSRGFTCPEGDRFNCFNMKIFCLADSCHGKYNSDGWLSEQLHV